MKQIESLKIKGYSFKGLIYASDLPPEDTDYLAAEDSELLEVEGDFDVHWDDNCPMVEVTSAYVYNGDRSIELPEEWFEDLSLILESFDDGTWETDHLSAMVDRAYDSLQDR
jgi:hypothetical protein